MKRQSLAKNAMLNTLRQLGAIAFPLVTFPYISRILGVTNYGKYTFSNSIVSYFSMFAALGITSYAIREGSGFRNDERKLTTFSDEVFTINMITMLISFCALIVLLCVWPKLQDYRLLILIQGLTIFFNTIGVEWLYSIFEDFSYVTMRSLSVQLVALVLMFTFVHSKDDYIIYAIITVLAAAGGNLFGFVYSRKYVHLKLTNHPHIMTHIGPMLILFFNAVAVTIYANSDITIIGIFKSNHTVGLYNVAVRIYTISKQLLNATVVVMLPRVSSYLHENKTKEYQELLNKTFNVLTILILPATVGLVILSPEIIKLIAGSAYIAGYRSLQILSIAIFFSVFASLITTGILLPKRREKKILVATMVGAIINILLNLVMIPIFSLNGAAITTLFAEFIVFLMSAYYGRDIFKFKRIMPTFFISIVSCIPIVVSCYYVKQLVHNNLLIVSLSILSSAVLYFISQFLFYFINRKLIAKKK